MKNIRSRQMVIGFIASVLAVTLTAGVAGSAFAARPAPRPNPRRVFQPVVNELNEINRELASVLERQPNARNVRAIVARLDALTRQIDRQESRVESLLAQEPVPPSPDLTAALLNVLAAANAIVQDAGTALALNSSVWPQQSVDAVSGVENAAQDIVNLVENSLGAILS
jgi:hypothetical protein